jgi:hypothetical protein
MTLVGQARIGHVVLSAILTLSIAGCDSSPAPDQKLVKLTDEGQIADALSRVRDSYDLTDFGKAVIAKSGLPGQWRADRDCGDMSHVYFECVRVMFEVPNSPLAISWGVLYNAKTTEFSQFSVTDETKDEVDLIFVPNNHYVSNAWNEHGNPFKDEK